MYRAGIIGCGFIGCEAPDNHAKAYRDCKDTELVIVCDSNIPNAIGAAKWPSCGRLYERYMDMVKRESLDIVSVCTPPETHCQIVCDIAPHTKAIYCEKPIALTLEDANKMIETCHKHNVILQVNHQRRFTNPKFRFSRGIINTGTHMFDLLRQLFGEPVSLTYGCILFENVVISIEEVDTEEPILELDCTHNKDPMILTGVEHLVSCIKHGVQSISSGEEARKTLELVLRYKELCEK